MVSLVLWYALARSSISASAHDGNLSEPIDFGNLSAGAFTHVQNRFALSFYQTTSHSFAILTEKHRWSPNVADGKCWRQHKDCVKGRWHWNKTEDVVKPYIGCTTDDFHNQGWCGITQEVITGHQQYRVCYLDRCKTPAQYPVTGEPWWWIIAKPYQQPLNVSNTAWSLFAKEFNEAVAQPLQWQGLRGILAHFWKGTWQGLHEILAHFWNGTWSDPMKYVGPPKDHPKSCTAILARNGEKTAMRAYPKRYCVGNLSSDFQRSFFLRVLPGLLPPLPRSKCLWEIEHLEPDTDYHVQVFSFDDGSAVPQSTPTPFAFFRVNTTKLPYARLEVTRWTLFLLVSAVGGVLVSICLSCLAVCCVDLKWRLTLFGCFPEGVLWAWCCGWSCCSGESNDDDEDDEGGRFLALLPTSCRCLDDQHVSDTRILRVFEDDEGGTEVSESLLPAENRADTDGLPADDEKLTIAAINRRFLYILVDLFASLTMLLPTIGPLCVVSVWHVYFGWRVRAVRDGFEKMSEKYDIWKISHFIAKIWDLVLNVLAIPFNLFYIQKYWLTYGHTIYNQAGIGVNFFNDKSYLDFRREVELFDVVAEWELAGLIPSMLLSVFLLTLEVESYQVKKQIAKYKRQSAIKLATLPISLPMPEGPTPTFTVCDETVEEEGARAKLNASAIIFLDNLESKFTQEFKGIYTQHFKLDGEAKEGTDDPNSERNSGKLYVLFGIISVAFGCLPHFWMCWRHRHMVHWLEWLPPLCNAKGVHPTWLYILNTTGVTYRFLKMATKVIMDHKDNIKQMAAFHAISTPAPKTHADSDRDKQRQWNQQISLFDHFEVETQRIKERKNGLEDFDNKYKGENAICLNMSSDVHPEHEVLWWALREYVMIDIKDERIMMEVFLLVTLLLTVVMIFAAFVANVVLREITAVTCVMFVVAVCGIVFGCVSLYFAKIINNMAREEGQLIQTLALQAQFKGIHQGGEDAKEGDLKSALEKAQRLLNLAGLVERQPLPETLLCFQVDITLITAITGPIITLLLGSIGHYLYKMLTVKI